VCLAAATPLPPFFVSVASKRFGFSVSPLDATLVGGHVSVDFNWVRRKHNSCAKLAPWPVARGRSSPWG